MKIKRLSGFFLHLLISILISQIILSPYLASAQEAKTLPFTQVVLGEIAMLDIEVNVGGAIITIDQQKKGKAPLRDIELSPGTHHVSVTKKGYLPWTSDLVIEPGEHPVIAAVLIPLDKVDKIDKTKEGQPAEKSKEISPPSAGPEAATGPKADEEGGIVEKQKVDLGLSTGQPAESSSAFYKTWWFWTLVVLAAGGAAAAAGGGGGGGGTSTTSPTTGTITITGPAP